MQNSYMPAFRSALSIACFFAGLVLVLRLLGFLEAVTHEISHWWTALPGIAGVAILARSFRHGPHIVVSGFLLLASGIAFATTNGFITGRTWTFAGAGGLVIAGMVLAWSGVKIRSTPASSKSTVKRVLFRAEDFAPSPTDLEGLKVYLLCGNIELDLRSSVIPDAPRSVFIIDIVACAGRVKVVVLPDTKIVNHKAFVMRFTKRVQGGVFKEEYIREADVVAATLAFFGDVDVEVRTKEGLLILASDAPGALWGPDHHAPTSE
jgi:hypothetical protein